MTRYTLRFSGLAALAAALFVLTGCDQEVTDEDIQEQQENVDDAQAKLEALKERQQVEDTMEAKLDELKQQIDRLEERVDDATGDREVQLRGELAELKAKYDQAKDRLSELRAASGDTWSQMKIKAEEAWNDVSRSVEKKVNEWQDDDDQANDADDNTTDENSADDDGTETQ